MLYYNSHLQAVTGQGYGAVGPYQGYDEKEDDDEDMDMVPGHHDGDYSMDAYGDTGYAGQQYYQQDYADVDL